MSSFFSLILQQRHRKIGRYMATLATEIVSSVDAMIKGLLVTSHDSVLCTTCMQKLGKGLLGVC